MFLFYKRDNREWHPQTLYLEEGESLPASAVVLKEGVSLWETTLPWGQKVRCVEPHKLAPGPGYQGPYMGSFFMKEITKGLVGVGRSFQMTGNGNCQKVVVK